MSSAGLVISPYAPAGLVSSTLYEHSSVPAFIEWLFGLPPLTVRDGDDHKYHRKIMHEAFKRSTLASYAERMNPMIAGGIAK